MSMNTDIVNLRSGKVKRQIFALGSLLETSRTREGLLNIYSSGALVSAVIDNGICSDNAIVRGRSICLIRLLYRIRLFRWAEVRNAVSSELSSPDSQEPLVEVLRLLSEFPKRELILFINTEDVMAAIKNICLMTNDFLRLRLCAIRYIGKILLIVWQGIDSGPFMLEKIKKFDSLADASRATEDLQDFIKDIFKGFALGVVGKSLVSEREGKPTEALIDIQALTSEYAYSIRCVLHEYHLHRQYIRPYILALIGAPVSVDTARRNDSAASLMPLIQAFFPTLFEEFSLSIARFCAFHSSTDLSAMISLLVLSLIRDTPYRNSSIIPIDPMKSTSSFLFGSSGSMCNTSDSRKDPSFSTIVSVTEEWIRCSVYTDSYTDPLDALEALYITVETLDDSRLVHLRVEYIFVVLDAIIAMLSRYECENLNLDCCFCELIGLGLYVLKSVPVGATLPSEPDEEYIQEDDGIDKKKICLSNSDEFIGSYLSRFLEFIGKLTLDLDVFKTRLCAELAVVALCKGEKLPADSRRIQILLDSSIARASLMNSSANATTRQRLGAAMCTVVNKLLSIFGALDPSCDVDELNRHLRESLTAALIVFKAFQRCLNWPIHGMQGEACQVAFVDMTRMLATILTNFETATQNPIVLNGFLSSVDEVAVYQMRDVFPSKLTKQKIYEFFAEFSVRLSLSGPHFNLPKANECILSYIKSDLLLEEFKLSQEYRVRGLVWSSTDPEISALESPSPVEATASIMRVFSVIDVLCDSHVEILDDVYDILSKFESCVLLQEINSPLAAFVDEHSLFQTKLFDRTLILESYVLIRRKVSALRRSTRASSTYTTKERPHIYRNPLDDLHAFESTVMKLPCSAEQEEVNKLAISSLLGPKPLAPLFFTSEQSTEFITDFGAFSNTQIVGSSRTISKLSTSDTFALIHDALFPNFMSKVKVEDPLEICNFEALYSDDRIQWRRVSGSSDPLVVLAYIDINASSLQFKVNVRVVNASGCNIPGFEVSAVTSGSMIPLENYRVPGEDYLPPNAMIEREFTFPLVKFTNISVIIRVLYTDLVKDHIDYIPITVMLASSKGSKQHETRQHETFTATVPCASLAVPAYSLLIPYGASSLSAFKSLYQPNEASIPKSVFSALFCRLEYSDQFEVASFFDLGDSSHSALCEVLRTRNKLPLLGTFEIGFASLVEGTDFDLKVGVEVICWALQTLWGAEIAVRLNMFKDDSATDPSVLGGATGGTIYFPKATWKGYIDVRSNSQTALTALMEDQEGFLHSLTNGLFQKKPEDFVGTTASIRQEMSPFAMFCNVAEYSKDVMFFPPTQSLAKISTLLL